MDKLTRYQQAIKDILQETAAYYKGSTNPLHVELYIDAQQQHFLLIMFGWDGRTYTHQCLYHIDIIGDKVWIQVNATDFSIEEELVKRGIPAQDIVLGLKHPDYRQFTDYAVA